jgi:hypothetical protein
MMMKRSRLVKTAAAVLMAACLAILPHSVISQTDEGPVVGTVFNDTDLSPTFYGPVVLDVVVDRHFMGRVEPGKNMEIALEPRLDPYEVRAYAFNYDGSSFFAAVDLPLTYTVVVPISHRGKLSSYWIAFEGIR